MSNVPSANICPQCRAALPADAPQGLCPACLLAAVAEPTEAGLAPLRKSPPPTREQVAAAFPQLEILELIGAGGMGFVFKARQPKLDRLVALKLLPPHLGADAAFAERFEREGRVLARLSHPNIVTVHDFGFAAAPSTFNLQPSTSGNGFFYLLMEFVDGVNLRQAMRAGRFTPVQALEVVPKICEALQFAHEQGVLHRDIKPENILLDSRGRVKLVDFGIAKLVARHSDVEAPAVPHSTLESRATPGDSLTHCGPTNLTSASAALGTPSYMAPEQRDRPAAVDHRADIYSLGVVFYEMLTGELPQGKFPAPSAKTPMDPRVDAVVLRALEQERERRQQSAGEMKTQVETIANAPTLPTVSNSASPTATSQPVFEADQSRTLLTFCGWGLVILAGLLLAIFNPWGRSGWETYTLAVIVWGGFSYLFCRPPNLRVLGSNLKQFDERVPMFGITLGLLTGSMLLATGNLFGLVFLGMALARFYKWNKHGSGTAPPRGIVSPSQPTGTAQTSGGMKTQVETIATTPGSSRREEAQTPSTPPRFLKIGTGTLATPERLATMEGQFCWWTRVRSRIQLAREIRAHLTEVEKGEFMKRSLLFAVWNAATWFGPFFCVMFLPSPLGWIYGPIALVIGLCFQPFLLQMMRESFCSTAWAREMGIQPDQFKAFASASPSPATSGKRWNVWVAWMISPWNIALCVAAFGGLGLMLTTVTLARRDAAPALVPTPPVLSEPTQPAIPEPPAYKDTAGSGGPAFGPVIERTIFIAAESKEQVFLDLDSGDFANAPADVFELLRIRFIGATQKPRGADERIAGWAKTSGADLMIGSTAPDVRSLALYGGVVSFPSLSFDQASPQDLVRAAAEATAQREKSDQPPAPFVLFSLPGAEGKGVTVFQTREGGMGILQVISTTKDPPSVKIRYKLVQTGNAK